VQKRNRRRQRGAGQVVPPRKSGGLWSVRVVVNGRRTLRGGLASKELAETALALRTHNIMLGKVGLPPDPKSQPILSDLADDFFMRRKVTHRAAADDQGRWKNHLAPHIGHLRAGEITRGTVVRLIDTKLAEKLNPATVRILLALASSFIEDGIERGYAQVNPFRGLPRSVLKKVRSTHDPKTVPFIEKLDDVLRLYAALPEPFGVAYAIGALAGLRTGEVFALKWEHVHLDTQRIHVRESVKGPLKDRDSRMVPILNLLMPILQAWKLKSGGRGLVVPPLRSDGRMVDKGTPGKMLRAALKVTGLARPGLCWYEATRHTFASQWVMSGGTIEKLKEILGHYSVIVTERYAHLRVDLFTEADLARLGTTKTTTSAPKGTVVKAAFGQQAPRRGKQAPKKTK